MFKAQLEGDWHNRPIWGDSKYVMASLLEEFAGKIEHVRHSFTGIEFRTKPIFADEQPGNFSWKSSF